MDAAKIFSYKIQSREFNKQIENCIFFYHVRFFMYAKHIPKWEKKPGNKNGVLEICARGIDWIFFYISKCIRRRIEFTLWKRSEFCVDIEKSAPLCIYICINISVGYYYICINASCTSSWVAIIITYNKIKERDFYHSVICCISLVGGSKYIITAISLKHCTSLYIHSWIYVFVNER